MGLMRATSNSEIAKKFRWQMETKVFPLADKADPVNNAYS